MTRRLLVVVVNACADVLDRVLCWWIPGARDDTMDVADAVGVTYVPPVLPTRLPTLPTRVPAQALHPCMRFRMSDEALATMLDDWSTRGVTGDE